NFPRNDIGLLTRPSGLLTRPSGLPSRHFVVLTRPWWIKASAALSGKVDTAPQAYRRPGVPSTSYSGCVHVSGSKYASTAIETPCPDDELRLETRFFRGHQPVDRFLLHDLCHFAAATNADTNGM